MGMYDYLGEEQIKIFYRPIFGSKDYKTGKPHTWHSGGTLTDYTNRELPLQTLYYKYPENFMVYDYWWGGSFIYLIKGGLFQDLVSITQLSNLDMQLNDAVYNYYGSELNIKTVEDLQQIKIDWEQSGEQLEKLKKELFPNYDGIFSSISNEEYKLKEEELNKIYEQTTGRFSKKWYPEDQYKYEKQLGEFIDCFIFHESRKDDEVWEWQNPIQDYLDCKQALIDFINEHDGIVDKYKEWLNNKNLIEKVDSVLNIIQ